MLQTIHDKLKGWVAYVVLGAIAASFVLWGINWTMAAPSYAAKVNGHEIPLNDVRQSYQQQLAQLDRRTGGTADELQRNQLKKQVLDDYIDSEALITRVEDLGYRVSDQDLLKEMAKIPAFQVDGKFDEAHAVAVLKAQGRSVAEIERLIRRQVQLEQLDAAMRASSFATPAEVNALTRPDPPAARTRVDRRAGRQLRGDGRPPMRRRSQPITTSTNSEYLTPETVNLRYVEISLAQLAAKVTVTDAQLRSVLRGTEDQNAGKLTASPSSAA